MSFRKIFFFLPFELLGEEVRKEEQPCEPEQQTDTVTAADALNQETNRDNDRNADICDERVFVHARHLLSVDGFLSF